MQAPYCDCKHAAFVRAATRRRRGVVDTRVPKSGLLNTIFASVGIEWRVNVYSMMGLIVVFGMYYAPYVYMFTAAALRNMDPALEEAAEVSGASAVRILFTVTFPLIAPAII